MIGYCKRCHLRTFIGLDGKCNSCSGPYYQYNRNYDETNTMTDPNIEFHKSCSILKDIDQAGNDW